LETLDLQIQFRKNLTPHAWGIVLFENLYCLNCVTGGDLRDTLDSRRNRLILALMVRETREVRKISLLMFFGWVYVPYVGHIDEVDYETLFHDFTNLK
jgi:hypothetical protein